MIDCNAYRLWLAYGYIVDDKNTVNLRSVLLEDYFRPVLMSIRV